MNSAKWLWRKKWKFIMIFFALWIASIFAVSMLWHATH